jgi:GNAT superfamily N-acetyltransferase/uncharacterized phage-associated protein
VRTVDGWNWRFRQQPGFCPEAIHVAEDTQSRRIVGVLAATTRRVNVSGKVYKFGMLDDASAHPEFRGRGILRRLNDELIQYLKDTGVDAVGAYVGYNTVPYRDLTRRAFIEVAPVAKMIKVLRTADLFAKLPLTLACYLFLKRLQSFSHKPQIMAGHVDLRVERPQDHAVRFIVSQSRDEVGRDLLTDEYWAWKYRPENKDSESCFVVAGTEKINAVAHMKIKSYFYGGPDDSFKVAILEDVLATESQYISPVLEKAISEAKREGAILVKADVDPRNQQLFRRLVDAGFSQFRQVIGVYRSENSTLNFSDVAETPWYVPTESVEGEP